MPDGSFEFPTVTPASTPQIYVDHAAKQVLSLEEEGDTFFGLLPGTNGTGPAMRRKCVPDGYVWLTSRCKRALGVYSVPTNTSEEIPNHWGFHVVIRRGTR